MGEVDGPAIDEDVANGGVAHVVGVDGARVGGVVGQGGDGDAGGGVDGAIPGAAVGDVHGAFVGGEADAVGFDESVFDDVDGAGGGAEAVDGGFEGGGAGGDVLLPAVEGVGEEDVAVPVDGDVVGGVEVGAEVVVEEGGDFVGFRVEHDDPGLFERAVAEGFAAADEPVDEPLVVSAAVYAVHGGIGGEFREGRGVGGEVDDELGDDVVGEFGKDDFVLRGDVHRSFVNGGTKLEHEFVGWVGAEDFQAALFVKDDEAGVSGEREGGILGYVGGLEIIVRLDGAVSRNGSLEWVRHHGRVFIYTDHAGRKVSA